MELGPKSSGVMILHSPKNGPHPVPWNLHGHDLRLAGSDHAPDRCASETLKKFTPDSGFFASLSPDMPEIPVLFSMRVERIKAGE